MVVESFGLKSPFVVSQPALSLPKGTMTGGSLSDIRPFAKLRATGMGDDRVRIIKRRLK
jgi:hypothetical protein